MSKSPIGTWEIYTDLEGQDRNAVKDGDGGQRAGLDYSLEVLGARKARGDDVEEETQLLIERAKKLNLERPEEIVRVTIHAWQRNAEFADKKKSQGK